MINTTNTAPSTENSLAQRRAAHALARVRKHAAAGITSYGNYVSYVSALPATILANGLGQAAATLLSQKTKKGHQQLFDDLQHWLCGDDPAAPFRNSTAPAPKLLSAITAGSESDYLRAQTEALAYLVWLKKLANGLLDAPENRDD